jgi:hypothetical protein
MRSLLILLAGLCLSIATSLVLYTAIHWGNEPFVEVLEGGQLRTNVDEGALDAAIVHVLKANSPADPMAEEQSAEADDYTPGVPWFAPPDLLGRSKKWTSRLTPKQLDQFGRPLQIEVLDDGDLQSLVVVHHNDRGAANRVAHHLALKLAERGVMSVN